MKANGSFPDCRLQVISPSVNVFQTPTHDPVALCVIPAGIHYYKKPIPSEKLQSSRNTTASNGAYDAVEDELDDPESLLPPDEPPLLAKYSQDGKVRKLAGTVTLLHVPSLPERLPPRHPLDKTTNAILAADEDSQDFTIPKLSGLSLVNPTLIERDTPPPIVGWTLEVPLDDSDLIHETPQAADGSNDKGKAKERPYQDLANPDEDRIKVRLLTAGMGIEGKVIVVLGTRGRIWVYKAQK